MIVAIITATGIDLGAIMHGAIVTLVTSGIATGDVVGIGVISIQSKQIKGYLKRSSCQESS